MKRHLLLSSAIMVLLTGTTLAQKDSAHKGSFSFCRCHVLLANQTDEMDFSRPPNGDRIDTIFTDEYLPQYIRLNSSCGKCKIDSFELLVKAGSLCKTYDTESSVFSPSMMFAMSTITTKDFFIIERVHITFPDGRRSVIPGETVILAVNEKHQ